MKLNDIVAETAVAGSIGAGAIASHPGGSTRRDLRTAEHNWRRDPSSHVHDERKSAKTKEQVEKAKKLLKKKKRWGIFSKIRRLGEGYDQSSILSRFRAASNSGLDVGMGTTKFGIEDDQGNIMKVTIRSEDVEEFTKFSQDLLSNFEMENNEFEKFKGKQGLADFLYQAKGQFNIINVEFPQIPADTVYNPPEQPPIQEPEEDFTGDGLEDDEFGMDDAGDMGDMGEGPDGGMGGEEDMDGDPGDMGDDLDDELESDDLDALPDEMEEEPSEQSLLQQILAMLTANAKAEEAKANAEAEKAKATQAEHSVTAQSAALKKEEELQRVELQMQAQKKKEKEAKRIADAAKFKASSGGSFFESIIKEFDEFDTVQSLNRAKMQLRTKFAPEEGDSPDDIAYKKKSHMLAMAELNQRMRRAKLADRHKQDTRKQEEEEEAVNDQNNDNRDPTSQNPTSSSQSRFNRSATRLV